MIVSYLYRKRLAITDQVWEDTIGIKGNGELGVFQPEKLAEYDKVEALKKMLKNPNNIPLSTKLTVGKFLMEYGLLRYAIARIIPPRKGNFVRVHDDGIRLMWAMTEGKKINWTTYFVATIYEFF